MQTHSIVVCIFQLCKCFTYHMSLLLCWCKYPISYLLDSSKWWRNGLYVVVGMQNWKFFRWLNITGNFLSFPWLEIIRWSIFVFDFYLASVNWQTCVLRFLLYTIQMLEHFNHLCIVCVLFWTVSDETMESVPKSIFLIHSIFNQHLRL